MARTLLHGESLDRMCCQRVRRGRKVTRNNHDAKSPAMTFDECDGIAESRPGIVPSQGKGQPRAVRPHRSRIEQAAACLSSGRDSRRRSPTIAKLKRLHNLCAIARMLLKMEK
jgi:hypothetical protein